MSILNWYGQVCSFGIVGRIFCVSPIHMLLYCSSLDHCRVNTCPFQGSRTIRSEEAVLISLARFRPHIFKNKEPSKVLSDDASSTNSKLATVDVKFSDSEPSDESSSSSSSEED